MVLQRLLTNYFNFRAHVFLSSLSILILCIQHLQLLLANFLLVDKLINLHQ